MNKADVWFKVSKNSARLTKMKKEKTHDAHAKVKWASEQISQTSHGRKATTSQSKLVNLPT